MTHPHLNKYTFLEYALVAVLNHNHFDAIVLQTLKKMEILIFKFCKKEAKKKTN